jgi:hypothetical protein
MNQPSKCPAVFYPPQYWAIKFHNSSATKVGPQYRYTDIPPPIVNPSTGWISVGLWVSVLDVLPPLELSWLLAGRSRGGINPRWKRSVHTNMSATNTSPRGHVGHIRYWIMVKLGSLWYGITRQRHIGKGQFGMWLLYLAYIVLVFKWWSFIQWGVACIYRPSQRSIGFYITYKY